MNALFDAAVNDPGPTIVVASSVVLVVLLALIAVVLWSGRRARHEALAEVEPAPAPVARTRVMPRVVQVDDRTAVQYVLYPVDERGRRG